MMSPRGVASFRPKCDAARLDIPRVHTPLLFLLIIGKRDIKRADFSDVARITRLIRLKHPSQVLTSLLARPSDKKSDATSLPAFSRWGQGHVFFSSKPTRWNRTLLPFTGLCSLSPDFIVTSLFKGSVLTLADPSCLTSEWHFVSPPIRIHLVPCLCLSLTALRILMPSPSIILLRES